MRNLLIIRAELSAPPSEISSFRTFTLVTHQISITNLIEVEQSDKDLYLKWMRPMGLMDWVDEFLTPAETRREESIRVDYELNYPFTVQADRITINNLNNLLGQIRYLRSF